MAKFLSFTTQLSVFFCFFDLSLASHRGWENRSRPDFLSPSFQPAVNASQQESNNVVFPPWEGELQASISTYLKCKSLSQSAISLPLVGARGCRYPWAPASWCGASQRSWGGFGVPGRVASLRLCLTPSTRGRRGWDGALQTWGVSSGCLCSLRVSPHPASLRPFGQVHPLSPNICCCLLSLDDLQSFSFSFFLEEK